MSAEIPGHVSDLLQYLPWVVILLMWLGGAVRSAVTTVILLRLISWVVKRQQPAAPVPVPAPVPPVPAPAPAPLHPAPAPLPAPIPAPAPLHPAPAPAPSPAPVSSDPFAAAPPWFKWALKEIGTAEIGSSNDGPAIARYRSLAKCGSPGDPWCAIFANAALESVGIPGTKSPSSQSFRTDTDYIQLSAPTLGALAVFWRGSPSSGLGHVGFYRGELGNNLWILGGNENNMVQIEALPRSAGNFGLVGYWWPKSVPVPSTGPVTMPQGSPTHVQAPPGVAAAPVVPAQWPKMTGITATMFGGSGDAQKSAYTGLPIDPTQPGCALPYHFTTITPEVVVTNPANGKSVTCKIVDVGPWNINDPYWTTGSRPQAESGIDTTGRHTNHAGIDLTPAAAAAIGIDGKGVVDWQFITV